MHCRARCRRTARIARGAAVIGAALLGATSVHAQRANATPSVRSSIQHVLLVSIDGLHQSDLDWYVGHVPDSTLARLVREGRSYTRASAPFPSDSFPGLLAQVTGALPAVTGVYYDDSYSRMLLPAGTTDCRGARPGAEVALVAILDRDSARLDAGQQIPELYGDLSRIRDLTGSPRELLDPRQLPVDAQTCQPILPHQYLRSNTVFDVAHAHGLRTAWADKHPSYEILQGSSGVGVDDLFAPEIDGSMTDPSAPGGAGAGFASDNTATQTYDQLKVNAVLQWIAGYDHAGKNAVGTPAIFGMNFQSISTAQKLNLSDYFSDPAIPTSREHGGLGGYVNGGLEPGPVLRGALRFVDEQLQRMIAALNLGSSVVVLSAKHGQSPRDRSRLLVIDDKQMLAALEAAWARAHPEGVRPLVAHAVDDDGVVLWLNDRTASATRFTAQFLRGYRGEGLGSDAHGKSVSRKFDDGGIARVYAGRDAALFLGARADDERVPDIVCVARAGSVWAGHELNKIAEHGGAAVDDRNVPIVVWGAGIRAGTSSATVHTTQIAPTLLSLLGLPQSELASARNGTLLPLPGLSAVR